VIAARVGSPIEGRNTCPRWARRTLAAVMCKLIRSAIAVLILVFPQIVSAQDKYFDSGGVRIRYVERRAGEPIVLVHGFTSSIERGWVDTGVMANLARDFHVIAFDLRGHGKSAKPHDPMAYGNEMVEDVVRLMDHLKIRRAHIAGHSQGGRVVAKLLTTHPDRFLTATLSASAGYRNWTDKNDREMEQEAIETEHGVFRALVLSIAPTDRPVPSADQIREASRIILQDYGNDPMALAALVRNRGALAVTGRADDGGAGAGTRDCR
jgi:pimeloyl-ACP methyl ester carboxylesterase